MEDINDPLEIKGVVYNEMKGAYSDPDRYLDSAVNTALFTDSPYRFESGGDPDKIPELTYEAFIDFYKNIIIPPTAISIFTERWISTKEWNILIGNIYPDMTNRSLIMRLNIRKTKTL